MRWIVIVVLLLVGCDQEIPDIEFCSEIEPQVVFCKKLISEKSRTLLDKNDIEHLKYDSVLIPISDLEKLIAYFEKHLSRKEQQELNKRLWDFVR